MVIYFDVNQRDNLHCLSTMVIIQPLWQPPVWDVYECSSPSEIPLYFHTGPDCTLSKLRLIRPSLFTHTRSVSEGLPYPIVLSDLGSVTADRRFSCALLPLGTAINRVLSISFPIEMGSTRFYGFPASRCVAKNCLHLVD